MEQLINYDNAVTTMRHGLICLSAPLLIGLDTLQVRIWPISRSICVLYGTISVMSH